MSSKLTTDVDKRLLRTTQFPPEFNQKVDMTKVNVPVIRTWVNSEIATILGNDDDVVTETIFNLIDGPRYPDIKALQISLNGFLDKDAPKFCHDLWKLCLSAQSSGSGVPKELLEAKKAELVQVRAEEDKRREEIRKRREAERKREEELEELRERERNERRGRGGRYGHGSDRRPPRRDSRSPPPRRRDDDDSYRPRASTDSYIPGRDRERRRSPSRSRTRSPPPRRRHRRRETRSPSRSSPPPTRRRRNSSSESQSPPPKRRRSDSRSPSRSPPRRKRSTDRPTMRDHGVERRSIRRGDTYRRSRSPIHRRRSRSPRRDRRRSSLREADSRSPPPKRTRRASPPRSRSPPRKKRAELVSTDLMSAKRRNEPRLSREPSSDTPAGAEVGDSQSET
ncbi:hypothetical protein BAUCODRAFT_35364 [Baudoinia panamericana UAMH 10762]|uniref:PWI domain-containing protein n=1 Tax=Baudoinia panamericana (strain UAMH 10762) TaxID=717646 RepID=M2MUX4_BAUPA|nr:uncharacterized protein BAUCODRAFT_35364 [Baudoinia panamericana UAMH 10762]EMC95383.1 hypothetical protein BAUCODRAFT_35364 [Baudoinia panamericana UAMH 10762]